MRWHKDIRVHEENKLRHPADSIVWKEFDEKYEWFAQDPRNVRLALASDGFNPFGNMSNSYSMWPVIVIPYNLPPWMCMTEPFKFMTFLIPGPKSPGDDIDVYMRPVIDELKELWSEGVQTYDAFSKQTFQLHAGMLWTINDFPAYANLSGWSTKGKLACPNCNKETDSLYLKHGRKISFMGHRRFLPTNHSWRKRTTIFNGLPEHRLPPKEISGDDVLEQLSNIRDVTFGKGSKKRKRTPIELNWTKKSIFFELPYYRTHKLRHNLDVMHIAKNVCDNILGTLMNIEGKTKDNVKSRMDLEQMGLRKELHLIREQDSYSIPHAWYTFIPKEKLSFCEWMKIVKFPDGYASNISRCVNIVDCKISGMKSHDCHVFLQRLLPVGIRGLLRKDVSSTLTELGLFFKDLCSRTLDIEVLDRLDKDIVIILCKLERIFPPSFFDVLVHLLVHLPREAKLGGPVQFRWMFSTERFLGSLKRSVRNKARPEGSIAEAYIDYECLTFCSLYLNNIETRFNREERNADGSQENEKNLISVFAQSVRPMKAPKFDVLNLEVLTKIRWYVLNNCEEIEQYLKEHKAEMERKYPTDFDAKHQEQFPKWFEERMKFLKARNSVEASDQLYSLACGPDHRVIKYTGCVVNGTRFRTQESEKNRTTQNCGVTVKGSHGLEDIDFYGVLIDIIELNYCMGNRVYLFNCEWWDTGNKKLGIRSDEYFTSVNFARKWYKNDPFIFANQAEQVFYLPDPKLGGTWHVVQKIKPRNMFDVPEANEECNNDGVENETSMGGGAYQEDFASGANEYVLNEDIDVAPLHIPNVVLDHVDSSIIHEEQATRDNTIIDDHEVDDVIEEVEYYNNDFEELFPSDSDTDDDEY